MMMKTLRVTIACCLWVLLLPYVLFAAAPAPTVSILNPRPGTAATPTVISLTPGSNDFKVQVQVWNDVADITAVAVGYYSGASPDHLTNFNWVAASVNANYTCGVNCAVYEARPGLAAGNYYLAARAQSAGDGIGYSADQRTGNDARYTFVSVKSAKTGTGTLLVRDASSQFCLDCHNLSGHSSQSTDTSYGNWQTVCLECHTPHSTNNIYLIRQSVVAPDGVTRTVNFFNITGDADNSYADSTPPGGGPNGICQVCHTQTQGPGSVVRWRYSGNADTHYTGAGTQKCTICHSHTSGFKGSGCINCHNQTQTGTHGTPRDAITTEFGLAYGHKKAGRTAVTNADCIVCHLEGDFTTQETSTVHADGNIDLRDPDGAGENVIKNISGADFPFQKFAISFAAGDRSSSGHTQNDVANVLTQKFCLACHDGDGATNPTARAGAAANNFMPFEGIDMGADYTVANGAANPGGLVNVKAQFQTANSSAHPVLGPRNKDFPTAARMSDPYKPAGTRGTSGTLSQGVVINCFDCHNTAGRLTSRTVAAHGNAVMIPGVLTVTGTPAAGTNQVTFCIVCHLGYNSSTATHHNTGSALSASTNNGMTIYLRYACNVCHGSTYNTAAVRPVRAMDVHGVNVLPAGGLTKVNRWAGNSYGTPAQVNARPYAFIRNTEVLTEHNPLKIGGSTYTPGCTMGNSTPNCSRAFQSYAPGGTY